MVGDDWIEAGAAHGQCEIVRAEWTHVGVEEAGFFVGLRVR